MDFEKLKENGFKLVVETNNYYPAIVKSGIYTLKSIHYNEETKEIKAIERKTVRSKTEYVKEISLDEIKNLKDDHPLKIGLVELEKNKLNNAVFKDNSVIEKMQDAKKAFISKNLDTSKDLNQKLKL